MSQAALEPAPEHKFAFGLWTIGHPGRDPFGDVVRPPIDPADFVRGLADIDAWGVTFHDDDLLPFGASDSEREAVLKRFRHALDDTGIVVSMATTNLFWHPVFKDGALTANDPAIRRYAIQKVLRNLDLAAELGAEMYVFWGGREGVEAMAAKNPADALDRYKEALDFLMGYCIDQGYPMRFALEPKPNEPRGDTFLPTVGHCLAFIEALEHSERVGLNPEVANETMAGLPSTTAWRRRYGTTSFSHRPQRAEDRAVRPGPAVRFRGHQGGRIQPGGGAACAGGGVRPRDAREPRLPQ